MIITKKKWVHFICIYFLLVFFAIVTLLTKFGYNEEGVALITFYDMLNGNRVMLYCFAGLVLLIPNIQCIYYFKYKENKFTELIRTRIGTPKYKKAILVQSFVVGVVFMFFFEITLLGCIHFFSTPIIFPESIHNYDFFSKNSFWNLVNYIIASSIGFGIYNMFLTSIIEYIKNEYIYRTIGIVHLTVSLIVFIVVNSFIQSVFNINTKNEEIIKVIISFFIPLNLYTPGLFLERSGYLSFGLSAIFYMVIIVILYHLSI